MKEKKMNIQASRGEENGHEHEKRDSPTPPSTLGFHSGGREGRRSKRAPFSLSWSAAQQ